MKRDKENAILGGVCAGLAKYLGAPILLVRILFLVGTIWLGAPLLIYLLLWLLMPAAKPGEKEFLENFNELKLDKDNKIIAGVCSGVANFAGVDPLIVRILWILGTLYVGFGIIAYLVMWLLMAANK
jgi:phage shock protein PspC (stress-responsive transcriptional regulator)